MKVTGPSGVGAPSGSRAARPTGEGFSLPAASTQAAGQTSAVGGASSVVGVQALLTLQAAGGPLERRRRAVGRAGRILDVLDGLKLALLDGGLDADDLLRLRSAVREEREATEDAQLESLLDQIETRAAVELAKLER